MQLELKKIDKKRVGPFFFKKLNGQYLLTNDVGNYYLLDPVSFDVFLSGKIEQTCPDKYLELQNKGFVRDRLDFNSLSGRYALKNLSLGQGPSLHIVVVTLRCDHACIYCQAGSAGLSAEGLDMDITTARRVVDRIFESPNQNITIEFQGGEPLVNFETVKFIIEYARKKNLQIKKNLVITVVSNLTFMNEEILKYFIRNNVHICTSLDGPEAVHNKCRIAGGGKNSYKNTVKWLRRLIKASQSSALHSKPSALSTITRNSLSCPKAIVDEYISLGLSEIHLRPLSPFVSNKKFLGKINFSAQDFIKFYIRALDYIIDLNLKGKNFHERTAAIFLTKILTDKDPDYLDLRSPCGAGVGQLAYNYNGDIYSCDEARMLSRMQDESFRLGNAKENSYQEIAASEVLGIMGAASCLDSLPGCNDCAYKPYCGVCPLCNYRENGNIFNRATNPCEINKAILDYLFNKLQDEKIKNIFYRWISR